MVDVSKLGLINTPSRKWWVSYNGGISMGVGTYGFVFRGDESLTGAEVSLVGAGPSISWGIGKATRATRPAGGGQSRVPRDRDRAVDDGLTDLGEDAINLNDAVADERRLNTATGP